MSKLIKADQCIEAHPCRLEPIDVDAFFISSDFSENETGMAEDTPEATAFLMPGEAGNEKNENGEAVDSRSVELSSGEQIDLSRLADFAGQLGVFIGGSKEQASTATDDIERSSALPKEDIHAAEVALEKVKQEAVRLFSGAKDQAEELAQKAKNQAKKLTQGAKMQAESLLEGAQSKFHELTEGAKQQAGSILEGAKQQAGDIAYGANRQAEQLINDVRQQGEFIIESANRKSSELLETVQLKARETIQNAGQKAAELCESTRQQTEEMLVKAREQAHEIKEQAQQEGFQAGHAAGLISVREEYEQKLAHILVLVAQAEAERLTRIRSSETELLKLAAAIAEKIIGEELKTNPDTQVGIVKQALAGIPTAGSIIIKVNSEDIQYIEKNLAAIQKVFSEPIPVKVREDPGIAAGNCYIETDHGNVDARIKTQLEGITAEILKVGRLE